MRLIVSTVDDDDPSVYIGTPTFEEGGVLRIDPDDPEPDGPKLATVWLSPAFWQVITEDVSYHPLKADYYHYRP